MCYEFELWNWKSRAKQRHENEVSQQSSQPAPQLTRQVQPKVPARDAETEEKAPA
jgi:hypothetical protein